MGHTIDFRKPEYFTDDEYTQHAYMILGRATSLNHSLFRNLPLSEDGQDIDFTVFENGPPRYISEFLQRLEADAVNRVFYAFHAVELTASAANN